MHPTHVRQQALALIANGVNDCEVSRRLGIARTTVRDWRRPTYVRKRLEICPRCWRPARRIRFTPGDYAELLGLYLGDGYISRGPRAYRMRIVLDAKYPGIIADAAELLRRSLPANRVDVTRSGVKGNCVNVSFYSCHLPCLFPQHGPGPKHARRIVLESWQQELLEQAPWAFLRGCIRSDGCAFVNRTGPYEYLSYDFTNRSGDIARLFTLACDLVGVQYRLTHNERRRVWHVRINRRSSVEPMSEHVGLKR